jgi:hypothetical protein
VLWNTLNKLALLEERVEHPVASQVGGNLDLVETVYCSNQIAASDGCLLFGFVLYLFQRMFVYERVEFRRTSTIREGCRSCPCRAATLILSQTYVPPSRCSQVMPLSTWRRRMGPSRGCACVSETVARIRKQGTGVGIITKEHVSRCGLRPIAPHACLFKSFRTQLRHFLGSEGRTVMKVLEHPVNGLTNRTLAARIGRKLLDHSVADLGGGPAALTCWTITSGG